MKSFKVVCIEVPKGISKNTPGKTYDVPVKVNDEVLVTDTDYDDGQPYYLTDIEIDGVLLGYVNSKYFKKV